MLDGVVEPAGCAHYRYSSVAHAVELVQPAGFIARGHEEDVAASFNLVRQRVVVNDLHRELLRILFVQLAEQLFIIAVAAAQHEHDHLLPGQAIGYLENKIEALLGGKTRHNANHRQLRVFRQAKFLQQIGFAFGFAAEVGCRVVRRNEAIAFGIPLIVIHGIQNAGDRARARTQTHLPNRSRTPQSGFPGYTSG